MIVAYDESYLQRARIALGNMLHFAVYDLEMDISDFYDDFISSGFANRFGKGEPKVIAGLSGIELAYEVINKTTGKMCTIKPSFTYERSPEYWVGWALAYYEWYKNMPFEKINSAVPISEVVRLYYPLHEADIMKFVDAMDELIDARND